MRNPVALLCLAIAALASPGAAVAKPIAEAERLGECFALADWTLAAGEALRAGVSKEAHSVVLREETAGRRDAHRAAIEAVYGDRPSELSEYIAAKLGACLREHGADAGEVFAKACYDQTLWAGMFFASKRRGVALERLVEGYRRGGDEGAALAGLAEAVYLSREPEAQFRRELFLECVTR